MVSKPKAYWNIINNLLNKCKITRIPLLLVADKLITDCKEKVKHFNDYIVDQCKHISNDRTLPMFIQISHVSLDTITIKRKLMFRIIKSLNVNEENGPDSISEHLIELCVENITLPLSIIF